MRLTKRERAILEQMRAGEELCHVMPGGWWIGNERTAGRIGWHFLRLGILRKTSAQIGMDIYELNSEGRAVLDDPDYVPLTLRHAREILHAAEQAGKNG